MSPNEADEEAIAIYSYTEISFQKFEEQSLDGGSTSFETTKETLEHGLVD